jgi:hypothetical protein
MKLSKEIREIVDFVDKTKYFNWMDLDKIHQKYKVIRERKEKLEKLNKL